MLLHLLNRRFGEVPPELEARLAHLDAAALPADAPSIEAFTRTLDDAAR